jgi:hypothetical protein
VTKLHTFLKSPGSFHQVWVKWLLPTWKGKKAEESMEDEGEGKFIVSTVTKGNLVEYLLYFKVCKTMFTSVGSIDTSGTQ